MENFGRMRNRACPSPASAENNPPCCIRRREASPSDRAALLPLFLSPPPLFPKPFPRQQKLRAASRTLRKQEAPAARAFRQIKTRKLARLPDLASARKCLVIAKQEPYIAHSDAPPAHSPHPTSVLANQSVPQARESRCLPTTALLPESSPRL